MENHICNRTVLITGASSGFGRQLALDLLDYEVDLILVARSKNRLERLRTQRPPCQTYSTWTSCPRPSATRICCTVKADDRQESVFSC